MPHGPPNYVKSKQKVGPTSKMFEIIILYPGFVVMLKKTSYGTLYLKALSSEMDPAEIRLIR
jgi:hypothetical protein